MDRTEMLGLIRGGVDAPGGTWADLGAGTGNFTRVLGELLGPRGTIYAVDRDRKAIERQRAAAVSSYIDRLCVRLRPHAQDLVDAFGYGPEHIRAAIALSSSVGQVAYITGPALGGVLATICPADKKIIHGMKDAILAPCAV